MNSNPLSACPPVRLTASEALAALVPRNPVPCTNAVNGFQQPATTDKSVHGVYIVMKISDVMCRWPRRRTDDAVGG